MAGKSDLVDYYDARAREYEKVYDKPERQSDLGVLRDVIPAVFAERHVLEIACGTGYWTRRIASQAASVIALDLAPSTLAFARAHQPDAENVHFQVGDAFDLMSVDGSVDAAFAGFWWSHVLRRDLGRFLTGLHAALAPGARVVFIDNRYVEGSSTPLSRTDADGNTYQSRRLDDGTTHEVRKNFPTADELRAAVAPFAIRSDVTLLDYFWMFDYTAR